MEEYLRDIALKFARPDAREMIYRADFESLLKSIFGIDGKILQINHDSTNDQGNKPDFVVSKNDVPILYIEAKDIGTNLDKVEKSDQMSRYYGYVNLVLTDYVEFRFYRNGIPYGNPVSLATINKEQRTLGYCPENFPLLKKTLLDFALTHKEPIKNGAHLARIMGGKAQRIRDNVREMLKSSSDKYAELVKMRDVVKQTLVSNLDDEQFADMYAQTLVYGLFAARYNDPTPENFSREEARDLVPASNPFLRSFFDHIAGSSFPERLRHIVDELCEVFTHSQIDKLLEDFYLKEKDSKDPVIHFYEDFLKEYDQKKKMEMGVFYTPRPVVQFIVRAVDSVLKSEFNLPAGLADTSTVTVERKVENDKGKEVKLQEEYAKVQVLDIATGTGTFLNEVIYQIYSGFEGQQRGSWEPYVLQKLLPRLHGFELMMASYTIAHLKLGMTLHRTGIRDQIPRLGIYLTNTLDKPVKRIAQGSFFGIMDSIAEESRLASQVKADYPIMVVIGNPPYSGVSMNKQYTDNVVYKVEPGGKEKLKEKKNWLDDDYVKFIRFGESLIEKNTDGVLGMITAHGYIDNPTFRGMRWHLRKTFDAIYIIDLHGNSNKDEVSPDGSKDENVFDIKTGVAIIVGVKKKDTVRTADQLGKVYVHDLYGKRSRKFSDLDGASLDSFAWKQIPDDADVWRIEGTGKAEYMKGFSVNDLFPISSTGIVTMGDSFIVSTSKAELKSRIEKFLYEKPSAVELTSEYKLGKNYGNWIVENRPKLEFDENKIIPIDYRPFDTRYTYFDPKLIWRSRVEVMQNMLEGENLALIASRQVKAGASWSHVFVSSRISESSLLSNKTGEIGSVFPLYLHDKSGERIPNLNTDIWKSLEEVTGKLNPENILDYVYGYLHKPEYINTYKEFLKVDFPRVPYPHDKEEFEGLADFGEKLRRIQLRDTSLESSTETSYPVPGTNEVERVEYRDSKVFINGTQYFHEVSEEIWEMSMGAYKPAQKYLKDRKGLVLSIDEIRYYQRLILSLLKTKETIRNI